MPIRGVNQFVDRIQALPRRVDLDALPGPTGVGRLSDALRDIVAEHHVERTGQERGPTAPWLPLSPRHLARKLRRGQPGKIGVATGEMLDPRQFYGVPPVVTNNFLAVAYGVTERARRVMGYFSRRRPALGPDAALRRKVQDAVRASLAAAGVGVRRR